MVTGQSGLQLDLVVKLVEMALRPTQETVLTLFQSMAATIVVHQILTLRAGFALSSHVPLVFSTQFITNVGYPCTLI